MNQTKNDRLQKAAKRILRLDGVGLQAREIRDNTVEAKQYQEALEPVASYIMSVAKSGDLPLMLTVEETLQNNDLEKYATNEKERAHVTQGLRQLETGIRKYQQLTETPDIYREDSKTYFTNERDNRRDVPKDGMRRALTSQNRRLQNRMSLTATDAEKMVLSARISLIKCIEKEYAREQERVVHGRPDDDITGGGGRNDSPGGKGSGPEGVENPDQNQLEIQQSIGGMQTQLEGIKSNETSALENTAQEIQTKIKDRIEQYDSRLARKEAQATKKLAEMKPPGKKPTIFKGSKARAQWQKNVAEYTKQKNLVSNIQQLRRRTATIRRNASLMRDTTERLKQRRIARSRRITPKMRDEHEKVMAARRKHLEEERRKELLKKLEQDQEQKRQQSTLLGQSRGLPGFQT